MNENYYYQVANDMDVIPIANNGGYYLRSESVNHKLEGKSSDVLIDSIFPLLDGRKDFKKIIENLKGIDPQDLQANLEHLVKLGIIHKNNVPFEKKAGLINGQFLVLLESLGINEKEAKTQLSDTHITLFGLTGHGIELAKLLVKSGIGKIILVDPFDHEISSENKEDGIYNNQEKALIELKKYDSPTQIECSSINTLNGEDSIRKIAGNTQMIVACFDRSFSSVNHWINKYCQKNPNTIALFMEASSYSAKIGPLVIPDQTACYMCYKMRSVACSADFESEMTYEEYLNQHKMPENRVRPMFPGLFQSMAGIACAEIFKYFLSPVNLRVASQVLSLDLLNGQLTTDFVFRKPDCPVCKKKRIGNIMT